MGWGNAKSKSTMMPAVPKPLDTSNWRIWDHGMECADRSTIRAIQWEHLSECVHRAWSSLPYYRRKMEAAKLTPDSIRTLDDLRLLPFTDKRDFMNAYPLGMLAVDKRHLVRIHGSTGTTLGKPTIVGYTRRDIDTWAEVCARFITAAGVGPDDVAQICFGYGLFTGGFGLHYGMEKIGAMVIPLAAGNTRRHIQFMRDFQTTAMVSTPSYALYLAETLKDMGLKPGDLALRCGLFGAEAWTNSMRSQIETGLGLKATDNYGLSEIIGPGVSGECLAQNGMHINEDHFLCEVVDPQTGEPVAEGQVGEMVITTLTKEAVPVFRYRTRDLTWLMPEPCICGRTSLRMGKVLGRTDDMLIIRGVNVFPSQIEEVLLDIKGTQPHYQIVVDRKGALDVLEVRVEVTEDLFNDEMKQLRGLEERIRERMRREIGLDIELKLVDSRTLERFEGKAKRVVDNRRDKK